MEGIVADELRFGGKLTDVRAENGRVLFSGDEDTLIWANMNLRCAERVLIRLAAFRADTFDQLFEGVKAIPWENFLPVDAAFPVKGHALDSKLHSVPDCQKIIKKAIVTRLGGHYGVSWFEEKGVRCQVQFSIMHDMAEIYLIPRARDCTSVAIVPMPTRHRCVRHWQQRWSSWHAGAAAMR